MNSIIESDFIQLLSDQHIEFSAWIGYPDIPKEKGKYSVRLSISNNPKLKWKGLSSHDRKLLRRVKNHLISHQKVRK